jgi:K+-sensing histidine kinase KdpD
MTQGAYQPTSGRPAPVEPTAEPGTESSGRALLNLVHALSHDLRGPLTLITGVLQTLLRSRDLQDLDPALGDFVEPAFDGADRMRRTLDDFLAAADTAFGDTIVRVRPVDPAEVLRRAVAQDPRLEGVTTVRGTNPPDVFVDPTHLAGAVTALAAAVLARGSARVTVDVAVGTARLVVVVVGDRPEHTAELPRELTLEAVAADGGQMNLGEYLAAARVGAIGGRLALVPIPGSGAGYRILLPRRRAAPEEA